MVNSKHTLLLTCILLPCVHGWLFRSQENQNVQAVGDVDEDCLRLADEGSCEFYSCLQRRFPCGRRAYAVSHGAHYCNRFQTYLHMFNQQGQRWVAESRRCMTSRMKTMYERNELTCKDISREGFQTTSDCFTRAGFCNTALDNKEALKKVFEIRHLFDFSAIRVWGEILDIAKACSGHHIANFVAWGLKQLNIDLPIHG